MEKLNRKGFTLIELLAIIVILAVIMVIAIPKMLDVMDSSKRSSLDDSVKITARGWNTNLASAGIATSLTDAEKTLYKGGFSSWTCFTSEQLQLLGLDPTQYTVGTGTISTDASGVVTNPICSMGKVTNGNAEVILVVTSDNSMYVDESTVTINGTKYMWARSDGTHSW